MIGAKRCMYIIEQLKKNGIVDIKSLAVNLDTSESSIRRDIDKLEKQGKLVRVMGGAKLSDSQEPDSIEFTMKEKRNLNYVAKAAVAAKAAEMINPGDVVYIDGGTSMVPLFHALSEMEISIVTNNQLVLESVKNIKAKVFFCGGTYLPHYSLTVGPFTEYCLSQFNFNYAFIGCTGVDMNTNFAYTSEVDSMNVKKIAMKQSNHSYLLIDKSKLQVKAYCKLIELSAFDGVICDSINEGPTPPSNFILLS